MKLHNYIKNAALLVVCALTTSCYRNSEQVVDDTYTCGRYMNRGFQSLCGNYEDSRQVRNRDDFWNYDDEYCAYNPDFIPFSDDAEGNGYAMNDAPVSKHSPGDPGSHVPGIDGFYNPSSNPLLASVYKPLHFDYNSQTIKGKENMQIIGNIANYMKQHPNLFLFVEGHCDIRGPDAYNLALGSRRSNEVRNLLIKEGVSPDNVFTISYGKEHLMAYGNDEEAHRQNRRAEFKVYQK